MVSHLTLNVLREKLFELTDPFRRNEPVTRGYPVQCPEQRRHFATGYASANGNGSDGEAVDPRKLEHRIDPLLHVACGHGNLPAPGRQRINHDTSANGAGG